MPLLYLLSMMALDAALPCGGDDALIKCVPRKKNEEDCMKDDRSVIFS